ncbi:MAG: SlyX family protein [Alphaproteobacteria bacterium]|nr:SlyX family protein [Alphaproteobacteria bacterium]
MHTNEDRLINIEMALTQQQKMLDELNSVVIEQGHRIEVLNKQNQYLLNILKQETVKPQSEETPPPHY